MGNDDTVADGEIGDALAKCDRLADELVAEHRSRRRDSRLQLEEVGPAEADDAELDEHLARPRQRQWTSLKRRLLAAGAGNDVAALGGGLSAGRVHGPHF